MLVCQNCPFRPPRLLCAGLVRGKSADKWQGLCAPKDKVGIKEMKRKSIIELDSTRTKPTKPVFLRHSVYCDNCSRAVSRPIICIVGFPAWQQMYQIEFEGCLLASSGLCCQADQHQHQYQCCRFPGQAPRFPLPALKHSRDPSNCLLSPKSEGHSKCIIWVGCWKWRPYSTNHCIGSFWIYQQGPTSEWFEVVSMEKRLS